MIAAPNVSPYASAKGGLIMLTKSLGIEWAQRGVRVVVYLPVKAAAAQRVGRGARSSTVIVTSKRGGGVVIAGAEKLSHYLWQGRKGNSGRAAEVDEIRTTGAVIVSGRANLLTRQLGRVVDLGQDLDVIAAVVLPRSVGLAQILTKLPQVARAILSIREAIEGGLWFHLSFGCF
mgnify:CR=1 FL=1